MRFVSVMTFFVGVTVGDAVVGPSTELCEGFKFSLSADDPNLLIQEEEEEDEDEEAAAAAATCSLICDCARFFSRSFQQP